MGVVIGRMDAVANECQEDTSGGFPKLVLYPAVSTQRKLRSKVVFTGNRDSPVLLTSCLRMQGSFRACSRRCEMHPLCSTWPSARCRRSGSSNRNCEFRFKTGIGHFGVGAVGWATG